MSYLLSNCHSSDYHYNNDISDTALATTIPHSTFLFIHQVINGYISTTTHNMINKTIFLKLYKLITPHVDKNYRYFPPTAFEIYTRDTFARYTDNLKDHQIKDKLVDLSVQICREWKFASAETKDVYRVLERCSHIVYEYMMKISRHDNLEKHSHISISSLIPPSTFTSNTNNLRPEYKNKSLVSFINQTDTRNKTLKIPIQSSTKQSSLSDHANHSNHVRCPSHRRLISRNFPYPENPISSNTRKLNLLLHEDSSPSDIMDPSASQFQLDFANAFFYESSKRPVKRFSSINRSSQCSIAPQIRRESLTNTPIISSRFGFSNCQFPLMQTPLMQIREISPVCPIQILDMKPDFLNNAYDLKLVRSINEKLEIDLHCKVSYSL
ncbi:1496_t:CDS:1 [Cetraspora pellucida]|uniref:1496_t:CDS:1 n=1 Tax=Cetraspora pellucida TaxID=1433469 RepID=A0ACA9NW45_9GLOM|nr:1496_t:CDS:1 [Cetraspora pellucida]